MTRRTGYGTKRQAIVQAALWILRCDGYQAVTVDRVLAAAEISKGTFYHYFSTKEELVEAVMLDVVDGITGRLLAAASAPVDAGPTERLATLLSLVRPGTDPDDPTNRALAGILLRTEALEALRTRMFTALTRRLSPVLSTILAQGARAGEFQVADPVVTAEMLIVLALSTRARVIAPDAPDADGPDADGPDADGPDADGPGSGPVAAARWIDGYLTIAERVLGLPTPTFARTDDSDGRAAALSGPATGDVHPGTRREA